MKKCNWLYLAIVLLLSACSHTRELVYQNIQNFSMQQGGKPSLALDIRLYNPNRYDLKLKDADVDVFLNGANLGKLRVDGRHLAPKMDTFLLPVKVDATLQGALPGMLQLAMSGDVQIKLTGYIKAGRHGFYISVPVNYEATENLLSHLK